MYRTPCLSIWGTTIGLSSESVPGFRISVTLSAAVVGSYWLIGWAAQSEPCQVHYLSFIHAAGSGLWRLPIVEIR